MYIDCYLKRGEGRGKIPGAAKSSGPWKFPGPWGPVKKTPCIYRVVFLTGPPDFQYQNEKNLLSQQGPFLH